jgi:hypothetical protein
MRGFSFLRFFLLLCCYFVCYVSQYPPCTGPIYKDSGLLDVTSMLFNCTANIPGQLLPPSYFNPTGEFLPTRVKIGIVLNNFLSVDDLSSQITMDFYYRLGWTDARLNIPSLFSELNPEVVKEGIDLAQYIRDANNPLSIWLPDIVFYQSTSVELLAELIKLYQGGRVYWSRHLLATFAEPQMSFRKFPRDVQNFSLVIQSYAHDNKFVILQLYNSSVILNEDSQLKTPYVEQNQLWTYLDYSAYVQNDLLPSPLNPERTYSTGYINLRFGRQPLGVVLRLALPITFLIIIVGFSFWAEPDKRLDVTLQMLLVVGAMYVIIGQIIPFVGYMTTMDIFITTVFGLLSVVVMIHFVTLILDKKVKDYPLNIFLRDIIQWVFRALWIPMCIVLFIYFFNIPETLFVTVFFSTTAFLLFVNALLKIDLLKRSFKASILRLRMKEAKLKVILLSRPADYDSDDDDDESLNDNRTSQVEQDDDENRGMQRAKRLKLTPFESLVIYWTKNLYQDEHSKKMVFSIKESNQRSKFSDSFSLFILSATTQKIIKTEEVNRRSLQGIQLSRKNTRDPPPVQNPLTSDRESFSL